MGERRGLKALELWAKRVTEGYPGVKIDNMTTSWRDGLAFCAIINHFRPDLIDFGKLNKDDVYLNNELAFRVGQQYLGIPALLDAEDMVEYPVPDRLSIITYLSQFYNALACTPGTSPTRIAPKRQGPVPDRNIVLPSSTSPPTKMAIRSNNATANMVIPKLKQCVTCKLPVFLIKLVVVGKQPYHAECFRCARCDTQLTPGNYYETEVSGQYCCETCPNEENQQTQEQQKELQVVSALVRSLSDEEKAASALFSESTKFCTAVEDNTVTSEYTLARTQFMQDLIEDAPVPPELPRSKPPELGLADNNNDKDKSDEISDNCLPDTDSLKLSCSVNNSDEWIINDRDDDINHVGSEHKDISTKEDMSSSDHVPDSILNEAENAFLGKDTDNNDSVIVVSSEESAVTITDDSNLHQQSQCRNIQELNDDFDFPNLEMHVTDVKPCPHDVSSIGSPIQEVHCSSSIKDTDDVCIIPNDKDVLVPQVQESSNPFDDTDDDADENFKEPKTPPRLKKMKPRPSEYKLTSGSTGETPESLKTHQYVRESLPPKPISTNPFSDDEDEEESVPQLRKLAVPGILLKLNSDSNEETPESFKTLYKRESVPPNYQVPCPLPKFVAQPGFNPFSEDEDDDVDVTETVPRPVTGYNPFSSDEDDDENDQSLLAPGSIISGNVQHRELSRSMNSLASTASSSINSATSTYRKKKQAPKPPVPIFNSSNTSPQVSLTSSPSTSAQHSPRPRKSKRAPPPPQIQIPTPSTFSSNIRNASTPNNNRVPPLPNKTLDFEKVAKDEANRQTQSNQTHIPSRDKSTYGIWKRKKGTAPALPAPLQKRTIKALPMAEIKRELDIIEVQLQGLDKQGIRLEKIIRDQCEGPESDPNASIPIEAEDLILQLLEVVNEKNEICRRQAELMYLRRQHRLEEEQAEIEYQVRCLMLQSCKTDTDKARETELIERLVEIVNLRAEIVECLEMDRVRGIQEDTSIEYSLNTYANKRDEAAAAALSSATAKESPGKSSKKKEKFKKKLLKFKRFAKLDVDKDIDESEVKIKSSTSSKNKKK